MSKARQLADLLDSNGDVVVGALDNAPDPDLTPYATNTSVTSNLTSVKQDLGILAFESARSDNRSAFSLPNAFVDQFEDDSGIDVTTTSQRDSGEFVTSNVTANATGGTKTTSGSYTYHEFESTQPEGGQRNGSDTYDFVLPEDVTLDFLVVGGGGSGKSVHPGGSNAYYGGAGGNGEKRLNQSKTAGTYSIVVGDGGYGWTTVHNGQSSSAFGVTATGGLHTQNPGVGPNGFFASEFSQFGDSGYFGGGGGGGNNNAGGLGGGGQGGNPGGPYLNGQDGQKSTGGGGGGGNTGANAAGSGGHGVVIIRYLTDDLITLNASGNFTGVTQIASSTVSSMSIVVMYEDFAGTASLNTDLVVQVSANNGTDWTTVNLASAPNLSGSIKVAKSNAVAVTAGTQPKYRINFANQASGSKVTRVLGVSLLY